MTPALRTEWGPAFWSRFYDDPHTRICTPDELFAEGVWLALTLRARLGLEIKSAVDVGSGNGLFADGLEQVLGAEVRRIDPHSPDPRAIRRRAEQRDFLGRGLIVCRDMLHYLDDEACTALLRMFNQSSAQALYIRVAAQGDAFTPQSDPEIVVRPADWYRSRLTKFVHLRFGLFVRAGVAVSLGMLE